MASADCSHVVGSAEAAGEAHRREARRARGHPVRGGAEEQTQVSPISLYITSQWSPNPSQVSLVPVTTFCLVSSILLPDPYLEPSSLSGPLTERLRFEAKWRVEIHTQDKFSQFKVSELSLQMLVCYF